MGTHTSGTGPNSPTPTEITVRSASRLLEIVFSDGLRFSFPFEFLRVFSPSAEVRGHGPGQETLQVGKRDVTVLGLEPVGHYAVQPSFSDGHDTGLYSWDYLYELGLHQDAFWEDYLRRLADAGASRDVDAAAPVAAAAAPACYSRDGSAHDNDGPAHSHDGDAHSHDGHAHSHDGHAHGHAQPHGVPAGKHDGHAHGNGAPVADAPATARCGSVEIRRPRK
jgi:DUF971 family protein